MKLDFKIKFYGEANTVVIDHKEHRHVCKFDDKGEFETDDMMTIAKLDGMNFPYKELREKGKSKSKTAVPQAKIETKEEVKEEVKEEINEIDKEVEDSDNDSIDELFE